VREGILLSLLVHALLVIAYLVMPQFKSRVDAVIMPKPEEQIQFVNMVPAKDVKAPPKPNVEMSDMDRRAKSRLVPSDQQNQTPFSRGNTPDKVVGAPAERMKGPDNPGPTQPPTPATLPDTAAKVITDSSVVPPRPQSGGLGNSLRNLQQYIQDQNYDNPQGGQAVENGDIDFDSKGVDFGPWLRRFVAQVKGNWYVPQAAMFLKGRVVIQFYISRNGNISEIKVLQSSSIEPFNLAALNALKLSNPTIKLPPEYPDDRMLMTVSFHYNDRERY
jgi:TonB family protein